MLFSPIALVIYLIAAFILLQTVWMVIKDMFHNKLTFALVALVGLVVVANLLR